MKTEIAKQLRKLAKGHKNGAEMRRVADEVDAKTTGMFAGTVDPDKMMMAHSRAQALLEE